jgi:hypothetical protein
MFCVGESTIVVAMLAEAWDFYTVPRMHPPAAKDVEFASEYVRDDF